MKYILGAGIAGLIYAFYNSEYYLISPEVGGQMKNNFNLGPRYLHDTDVSRQFLKDLHVPLHRSTIKIAHKDDNGWVQDPDIEFRKKYFMKSRNQKTLSGFDESVMSGNKNEFDILLVNFNGLIAILKNKIGDHRFICESVESINRNSKRITTHNKTPKWRDYEHIVSTIPIKYLNEMLDKKITDKPFESFDMTYVFTDEFEDLDDYNYVYDIRSTTNWHRMSKEKNGLVLDFFGNLTLDSKELDTIRDKIRDFKVLKNAQIVSREDIQNTEDIEFIGRYGTWSRRWKTEKVIEQSMKAK